VGTVLRGGVVVELEPASVEIADLRVEGHRITARGRGVTPQAGDEVIDLKGKVVMAGLVSAHHHLHRAITRSLPAPATESWLDDERWRWKLEDALDLDGVEVSAALGALDALSAGTTTIVDEHSSPGAITGSLARVARGVNGVGLRAAIGYQVSDRGGPDKREAALRECVDFAKIAQGRFRGMVAAQAVFTSTDPTLAAIAKAVEASKAVLHLPLAEDPTDERLSRETHGDTPVARLLAANLLGPRTVVAQVVHLAWPELAQVIATGAWIGHSPRSNMDRQVGYAPAAKFGARSLLGTDGVGADMFEEARLAQLRSRDAGAPYNVLRSLANGQRLASELFGETIGPLREGATADLIVLDYRSPSPITPETLAWHLVSGFSARWVESVMVDGVWKLWGRKPLTVNADVLAGHAREVARAVFSRTRAR
jgi:cytosine/adenosine deaminase-related metal-dependent hydrolase